MKKNRAVALLVATFCVIPILWLFATANAEDFNLRGNNLTLTGNITGDSTGNISGFDNATFTGRTTTATLTVTGVATFTDNTINGADVIDNTVTNAKLIDNTITPEKIAATGSDNAAYLRRDGTWSLPSITTSNAILSSYKGLTITTPADNQSVTITADHVVVVDNTNEARILSTVSLTVNLDVAGANGLDNGAIAANTGYYLYVIDNGATTAGLASTSATAPVMPSGYTYKALVGWCTTDNTATPFNIEEFTQIDDEYVWSAPQQVFASGAASTTTRSVDLSATGIAGYAVVPPSTTTKTARVKLKSANVVVFVHPSTFGNTLSPYNDVTSVELYGGGAGEPVYVFTLPLLESQVFYWQANGTATSIIWISGFTLKR